MKVVIQRVAYASVKVNEQTIGSIDKGLLLLIGIDQTDLESDADYLVNKIQNLRIFSDDQGLMNLSIQQVMGEILCVSQFTLIAEYKKGNRPSFINAAKPPLAKPLFDYFKSQLQKTGLKVESGEFGADMDVLLCNDGPVTIVMDSKTKI